MLDSNDQNECFSIEKSTALLSKLVEVDTCQPAGNEARLVSLIEDRYSELPVVMTRLDHGLGRASLVIELPGKQKKDSLAFVGHLDTVPVGDPAKWDSHPLTPTAHQGKLVARGSADMKGGVAAMLLALDYLIQSQQERQKSLFFCFTADEEKDGLGAVALKHSGLIDDAAQMIICEPSGGGIGLCEKGALWVRVSAEGVSSHASRPELGRNAIQALLAFMNQVYQGLDTSQTHPFLGHNTLSITQFKGGISTNIVPSQAELTLDIRTLPGVSHLEILKMIGEICQEVQSKMSPLYMKVEIVNDRPPLETPETDDLVLNLRLVHKICVRCFGGIPLASGLQILHHFGGFSFFRSSLLPYIAHQSPELLSQTHVS